MDKKEKLGWIMIAEESFKDLWINDKDESIWIRYLPEESQNYF